MSTLISLFEFQVGKNPDHNALRCRVDGGPFLTWRDWWIRSERIAAGLLASGLQPGDRVLLSSRTRLEWVLCDMAIMMAGGITVPLFPSLLPESAQWIAINSGARAAIVEDPSQWEKLSELKFDLPGVVFDTDVSLGQADWKGRNNLRLEDIHGEKPVELGRIESLGARELVAHPNIVSESRRGRTEDDLATIVYTSGTSRDPVGVPLTHGNLAHEAQAVAKLRLVEPHDVQLLFLPLAHIFARVLYLSGLGAGFCTVLEPSPAHLLEACAETRPTFFAGVPHVFEILRRRIEDEIRRDPVTGRVFRASLERSGRWQLVSNVALTLLRRRFGGEIRFLISGGAPLSKETAKFFESLGLPILEGYGLTEASGVATFNVLDERRLGTVGRPLPGVQVAIDDDGEILIRGPSVMKGYWSGARENPIGPDGWLRTGDLGEYDAAGFLTVTGRKKELLVTSGGKNIVPMWIEELLTNSDFIDAALLVGDGRPFLTALIQPNWDRIGDHLGGRISEDDRAVRVNDRAVRDVIEHEIARTNQHLSPHERIQRFALLPKPFVGGKEVTPTLKMKRHEILANYADLVESLYARSEVRRV